MTARRRRKSGSGPSATALIAWVGGTHTGIGAPAIAPFPVITSAPTGRMADSRAIFLGRACGLAAGTLLACGSVLAAATQVGDGSLAQDSAPLLNPTPAAPADSADLPAAYQADPLGEPAPAPTAPDGVSIQAVSEPSPPLHPRLGQVRRNAPVALDMPAEQSVQSHRTAEQPRQSPPPATGSRPQDPVTPVRPTPVSPVLDPAASEVGRVAPVGGVLTPGNPSTPTNPSGPTNPRQVRADGARDKQGGSPRDDQPASAREKRTGGTVDTGSTVDTVQKVAAPVDRTLSQTLEPVKPVLQPATRPAMAMLGSLLPIG